ncbi:MAG: hypothetical protein AAB614_00200 [Patescibacteria group bacterium]
MQKQKIFLIVALFLFVPLFFAFAAIVNPLGTVDTIPEIICLGVSFLSTKLMPPLAVLFIFWAGFLYLTAAGNSENIKKANNTLVAVVIGIAVLLLAPALVALTVQISGGPSSGAPVGATTAVTSICKVVTSTSNITNALVNLINWFAWFVSLTSVAMGLYAGFLFMTSGGDPKKREEATKTFVFTLIGVAVAILAFSIISIAEVFIK